MLLIRLFYIFLFSVISVESFSQVGVINGKVLGGSIDNEFVQIQKTPDNHYLISESTTSGWYMVKMDTLFNLIWQKSVAAVGEFALTADSGYVVVSSQFNEAHSWSPDVAIHKFDKNGDIKWSKYYGGNGDEYGSRIKVSTTGDILVSAIVSSTDGDVIGKTTTDQDIWILRLNSTGQLLDQSIIKGSENEVRNVLMLNQANELFVAVGSSSINGNYIGNKGFSDTWLFKFDSNLDIVFSKNYGGSGDDTPNCMQQTLGGEIYIGGITSSSNGDFLPTAGYNDGYIIKLDVNRNKIWARGIRGSWNDQVAGIAILSNGDVAITGGSSSGEIEEVARPNYHTYLESVLMRFNANGKLLWSKSVGSDCDDNTTGVTETANHNLIVIGSTWYCSYNGDMAGISHVPGEIVALILEIGDLNTIYGNVYYDNNNNNQIDVGEPGYLEVNSQVRTQKNDIIYRQNLFTEKFMNSVDTGDFITTFNPNGNIDLSGYGVSPRIKNTHFSSLHQQDSFSFRIVPIELIKNIKIEVTQLTRSFVNNSVKYLIKVSNLGGHSIDTVDLVAVATNGLRYNISSKPLFSSIGDILKWRFVSFPANGSDSFNLELKVKALNEVTVGGIEGFQLVAEPFLTDFDSVDNKVVINSVVENQNAAISNFSVNAFVLDSARVNRPIRYGIRYNFNSLLDTTLGFVKLVKSHYTSFVSANPIPSSIIQDTVIWNFKDLKFSDADSIDFVLKINDTPNVTIGQIIQHNFEVSLVTQDTTQLKIPNVFTQSVYWYYTAPDITNTTLLPPNGIRWSRLMGGSDRDFIKDVIPLADSGYIVVGASRSKDKQIIIQSDSLDAFISRFDKDGRRLWIKSYGDVENDEFEKVIKLADGNFLATGYKTIPSGYPHGIDEAWAVKFNEHGDTLWTSQFGSSGSESFKSACELNDGSLVLAGITNFGGGDVIDYYNPFGITGKNFWIVKLDQFGKKIWAHCITDSVSDYFATDIKATLDGKIIISGTTHPFYNNNLNGVLVKIDTACKVLWKHPYYYGNFDVSISSFVENPDSSLVVTGLKGIFINDTAYVGQHGNSDVWVAKMSSSGEIIWEKYFGGKEYDYGNSIRKSNDGKYIISGATFSDDGNVSDAHGRLYFSDGWLLLVDQNGQLIWQKTVGGNLNEDLTVAVPLADASIMAVGYTTSDASGDIYNSNGGTDALMVKVDKSKLVRGQVYFDKNNNGIKDASDVAYSNALVVASRDSLIWGTSISNGFYNLSIDTGLFVFSLKLSDTNYFSPLPKLDTIQVSNFLQEDTLDFRVVSKSAINDLLISIIPQSVARPGFHASYLLHYENAGTTDLNNVSIEFIGGDRQSYVESSLPYTNSNADTVRWDIGSLNSLQKGDIIVTTQILPPPYVINGSGIISKVVINPIVGDTSSFNNISEVIQTAQGSYDPNDKVENHQGKITPQMVAGNESLVYTIRFQNTGTDTAFNIVVKDTLDDRLNGATLEMIGASHSYEFSIKNGKYLEWDFKNVLLPDSNINEPLSHGFLSFRVKVNSTVSLFDTVSNKASIYFDFNLPVVTNTVNTRIVNDISAVCPGGVLELPVTFTGSGYQWQSSNNGSQYVNLSDNSTYQGSIADTLRISISGTGLFGTKYRCKTVTQNGALYSKEYTIKFVSEWIGGQNKDWNNPLNWSCGFVPDEFTDVVIEAGKINFPEISANAICNSILIKPGALLTIKGSFALIVRSRK